MAISPSSLRSARLWQAASALAFLLALWWIYPYFSIRSSPCFNSDSALALLPITEPVPFAENVFQWGAARAGSALTAAGWVFYRFFRETHLIQFLSVANAALFVTGCCVLAARRGSAGRPVFVPVGLLLVLANFTGTCWTNGFPFTITDIAHRPEAAPLAVVLGWLLLAASLRQQTGDRAWWTRVLLALLVAMTATWVSELAIVAGFVVAGVAFARAALFRQRWPWETLVVWGASIVSLRILRAMSVEGKTETRRLYEMPSAETFRELFGTAMANMWAALTPFTWLVVLGLGVLLNAIAVHCACRDRERLRQSAAWQGLALWWTGAIALLLPLGNNWVYLNGVELRYFSLGALLLCLGAAQGAVWLFQNSLHTRYARPLAAGVVVLTLVPLAMSFGSHIASRSQLAAAGDSPMFRSSQMLVDAGTRVILGDFWRSYAYVVAKPGVLKAAPVPPDRESRTNTLRALSRHSFVWVSEDPKTLISRMNARGVELKAIGNAEATQLPTGAYFRRYRRAGAFRLQFGRPDSRVYLKDGWSGDEWDATRSWVWAVHDVARIDVPLRQDRSYTVELTGTAAMDCQEPPEVTIKCDGLQLGVLQLGPNGRFHDRFVIPAGSGADVVRQVKFVSKKCGDADRTAPRTGDPRTFFVALETANFTPAP